MKLFLTLPLLSLRVLSAVVSTPENSTESELAPALNTSEPQEPPATIFNQMMDIQNLIDTIRKQNEDAFQQIQNAFPNMLSGAVGNVDKD